MSWSQGGRSTLPDSLLALLVVRGRRVPLRPAAPFGMQTIRNAVARELP